MGSDRNCFQGAGIFLVWLGQGYQDSYGQEYRGGGGKDGMLVVMDGEG